MTQDNLREQIITLIGDMPSEFSLGEIVDAIFAAIAEHSPEVAVLVEQARKIGALRIGVRDGLLITEMADALIVQAARIARLEGYVSGFWQRRNRQAGRIRKLEARIAELETERDGLAARLEIYAQADFEKHMKNIWKAAP